MKEVRLRFDADGHLYLIPEILTGVFDRECNFLEGIDYDDSPDAFEEFEEKFKKFRKEGDIYETELFIKEN